MLLTFLPLLLGGCTGGQEIESSLFVIAMAVDAAPEGNLTITVKALSGSQESAASGASGTQSEAGSTENLEQTETGYIVLSATAPSCLRALGLLGATTPRTVNLSQLQEIVISQTLAETDATLSILKQIHAIYRANDEAVVVVTPDHAGDFIRRQRAVLGLRLSKYLEVLFEHYEQLDVIPPSPNLSAVIAAMGTILTNKYAEGYPGKRYYGGCEYVDEVECIAIERAKQLFGAEYANVQPHSGAQANLEAYQALLQPGDTVVGMSLANGGSTRSAPSC